ncbi:CorA family divalent cation transporter [Sulfurovum sp.]|uniref:CorA family divalent cation transporter n=1 Tax=Sulfurovum sp. TaxID=1969726 RepID=UPI002A36378B|nr:CorA family divalent cation transporter [Sulfurovum sp.]MDY0403675.1 CorA family divalent cation transporter [Sulfurovum sp.]
MAIDKENTVFLLGGHDLEMIEIRKVLEEEGIPYIDRALSWGAKLSDYQQDIRNNRDKQFYAIELTVDDPSLLESYPIEIIDHHNAYSDREASLLQVLALLDKVPTRYQKLVAANDSRYIPGMRALCASKKEIEEIREKDRSAQGVSAEDETLAMASVNSAKADKTNIFYTKTPHFSAITDNIYFDHNEYIIYSDHKIVFYGYKFSKIEEFFGLQHIKEDDYYYGGGEFGFVGIKDDMLAKTEIEALVDAFERMILKNETYSTHIFMFPFVMDKDIKEVNETLCGSESLWRRKTFDISESHEHYNEYIYFYDYVRKALYETEASDEKGISYYYEFKEQKGVFALKLPDDEFELAIDGVSLCTFDTGIGILSIELLNHNYKDADKVLKINDFGRRLYPQFLTKSAVDETGFDLSVVKGALLPCEVTVRFDGDLDPMVEDFSHYSKKENLKKDPTHLPSYIQKMLGEKFTSAEAEKEKIHVEPIIDDRMFVISMYMNDDIADEMKAYDAKEQTYAYENDAFWYKYIFVDGSDKTCQSQHMTKVLIKESTYDRWVEWGTLYGISRYSFVALTGEWFGKNRLAPHMRTMYYQIFTLLLAYRASILKFSRRVADLKLAASTLEHIQEEAAEIYRDYIDFQNNLFFREVTAQDQGIEIYTQALGVMRIEKYLKDLDSEIAELHNYIEMKTEKKRNDRLENISKLGAVFLPPSLLAGIFGMNIFDFNQSDRSMAIAIAAMVVSAILGYLWVSRKQNVAKRLFIPVSILLGIVIGVIISFAIGEKKEVEKPIEIKCQKTMNSSEEVICQTVSTK